MFLPDLGHWSPLGHFFRKSSSSDDKTGGVWAVLNLSRVMHTVNNLIVSFFVSVSLFYFLLLWKYWTGQANSLVNYWLIEDNLNSSKNPLHESLDSPSSTLISRMCSDISRPVSVHKCTKNTKKKTFFLLYNAIWGSSTLNVRLKFFGLLLSSTKKHTHTRTLRIRGAAHLHHHIYHHCWAESESKLEINCAFSWHNQTTGKRTGHF